MHVLDLLLGAGQSTNANRNSFLIWLKKTHSVHKVREPHIGKCNANDLCKCLQPYTQKMRLSA